MIANDSVNDLEGRAIAALNAVLGQVSVIKLKDIKCEAHGSGSDSNLVAHVEIMGQSHTLACDLLSSIQPENLRSSLQHVSDSKSSTRVLIAPYLTPEMQSLCKESHTGFLDLEGNARISLGEIFIGRRSAVKPAMNTEAIKSLPPRSESRNNSKAAATCHA